MAPHEDEGPVAIGASFAAKYRITALLGRGGQAWVYRAQHLVMGREVAIKVVYSVHGIKPEMVARGKAEAEMLGKLDHANVMRLYDAGFSQNDLFYMVMELLEGRNLRVTLADYGPLRVEEVLRLGIKIAHAMQAAHDANIIHRDLKPDNLFIGRNGEPKVLDFGIGRMLDQIGITRRKFGVVGTLVYMSSEQTRGQPDLTPQTDVCSLGIVLFELLVGKTPTVLLFDHYLASRNEPPRVGTLRELAPLQASGIPPLLSDLDAGIPIYLAQVIQRAIAKSIEQRFQSMTELAAALQFCLDTWLVDASAGARLRKRARDLSLPAPAAERAPRPAPPQARPSQRETVNAVALGQQVTDDVRLITVPNHNAGHALGASMSRPSFAPDGAETAPLGTTPSAQLQRTTASESGQHSKVLPAALTRKSKPAQLASDRELAALWADPGTQPPVILPPRSISLRSRTADRSPVSKGARRALARSVLIVAGLGFGGTAGTAGARAIFRGQPLNLRAPVAAAIAPTREPSLREALAPQPFAQQVTQAPTAQAAPVPIPATAQPTPPPRSMKVASAAPSTSARTTARSQPQQASPATSAEPRDTPVKPDKPNRAIY